MKSNQEIAQHLNDIAALYEYSNQNWKSRAYLNAATLLMGRFDGLPFDDTGYLQEKLPGVGASIQGTIEEFNWYGKSGKLKSLLKKGGPPPSLRQLERIPMLGPKTSIKIWKELKITNLADFEKKLKKVENSDFAKFIPGFWQIKDASERLPTGLVKATMNPILLPLTDLGIKWEYAGSARRGSETVRDIDVIVCLKTPKQKEVVKGYLEQTLGLVPYKKRGEHKWGIDVPIAGQTITLDLNFCEPAYYGAYLNYFTGSKDFNEVLRTYAKARGFRINEYGIFKQSNLEKSLGGEYEEDLFEALKIPWVPPECRNGEALDANIDWDKLITEKDIVADLHCHSIHSDGSATWDQLFKAADKQKLKFLGITDHSSGSGNGPKPDKSKKLVSQFETWCETNVKMWCAYGHEIDVKTNKQLDYAPDLIANLDYFLISAHHSPQINLTERYIAAMYAHPKMAKIIAHPTNRSISGRLPAEANWSKIFEVCRQTNTVLEINGQPDRQDLPPDLARKAQESGVKFAINSDCHGTNFRKLLSVGVQCARRGWILKENVINTNLKTLNSWLEGKLYRERGPKNDK